VSATASESQDQRAICFGFERACPNMTCMAKTPEPRDEDLIAELADIGERTLRRIVEYPRRVVAESRERVGGRLDDVATKLRSIDPLARRVAELEKRLDSLATTDKPASKRAKPSPSSAASEVSAPADSKRVTDDLGPLAEHSAP
jgi:hypothetical protein